jgi:hypothetical protein
MGTVRMAFPQSRYAYADMQKPSPWFVCDRCGFRKMKSESAWQFDYRGLELQNLRILVCQVCLDNPQPQLRPIIIGPDPVPVKDPRPGFAAQQMGYTAPVNVLEIIDGDLIPPPPRQPTLMDLLDDSGRVIDADTPLRRP